MSARVLIVDDNESLRRVFSALLINGVFILVLQQDAVLNLDGGQIAWPDADKGEFRGGNFVFGDYDFILGFFGME